MRERSEVLTSMAPYRKTMKQLLAVDLGLRTGIALYGGDGRLVWYRSRHFGNAAQLRHRIHALLQGLPELSEIVIEGGGPLAEFWLREGRRRSVDICRIGAEDWRPEFFYPREVRTTILAKRNAAKLARKVIDWAGAERPTSLRHDAAEAILIGLWGVIQKGWLERLPACVRTARNSS